MAIKKRGLVNVLETKEREILNSWMKALRLKIRLSDYSITEEELRQETIEILREFVKAVSQVEDNDIRNEAYSGLITRLQELSRARAIAGFSPTETAIYVFSLKDVMTEYLQKDLADDSKLLSEETTRLNQLLDKLGLVTFEEYSKNRDEIMKEQRLSIMELSSPIVTLWEKVIAIPIIGVLDSKRTQTIMEHLLEKIVNKEIRVCIIDITGVSVMDTLVSAHLVKTSEAIALLGAKAVITGIRPEVAQTIVHLGVDLSNLETRANMADGLKYAFRYMNLEVERKEN